MKACERLQRLNWFMHRLKEPLSLGRQGRTAWVRCFSLDDHSPDVLRSRMPRRLRIEFEEAIDHVMARGDPRQKIVRYGADRRRVIDGLPLKRLSRIAERGRFVRKRLPGQATRPK
jgi:hypothetical protein